MRTFLAGLWLLSTLAFVLGCSDPVGASETPRQVKITVGAEGADLAAVVRAYPPGTAFYLSGGVLRTSTSVSPKRGDSFTGDAGAITPVRKLAE